MDTATIIWSALFCASAGLLLWAYAGYAVAVFWRAKRVGGQQRPMANPQSSVAVVIAARNEAASITKKLHALLSLGQKELQEIIVVCDHCTDDTAAQVESIGSKLIKCVRNDVGPSGKAAALNAGIAAATTDLVFFTDVRQIIAPDSLRLLSAWFVDPTTGAVSGSLDIQASSAGSGKGLDAYWSLEKRIRHAESSLDSSVGCTGAIYMIRRELYTPIPADTILDDVVIPMLIAEQGKRVRFDPDARAFDPQPLTGSQEARRKTRTLAGNFQMLARYPRWLVPWRHRLWFALFSHKYLRILSPLLLLNVFIATVALAHHKAFFVLLVLELVVSIFAVLGLLIPHVRSRVFAIPAAFLMLQFSVLKGLVFWFTSKLRGQQGWK